MKILLVDDNKSTTKMMSTFLSAKNDNYQVNVADNGLQALDYYPSFKPDVVVLDISMPGMDGIETLSRLFKIDQDANIIMASATDALRTVEICLQKGAIGYISKPYSPEELLTSIQNAQKGGIYKRDLTVFFTRTAKKLEAVIHKMTNTNIGITFEDIEIIPNYSTSMMNTTSIRSIKNEINDTKIEINDHHVAYSTEIGGQLDGTIVSVINKNDLQFILDKNNVQNIKFNDIALEFFNIVNTNVMSQLVDSMNVKLDALPVREYIKDKDSFVKNKDLTRVKFNIKIENKIITLDVHLWISMSHLFKHLF